jgi:hypothetical protein
VAVAVVLPLSRLTPLNRGRIASPDYRHKASHQCGDFIRSRIQGKVAGVEYVHFGFGNVLAIAFRFTEIEGQIVLTPDHQEPWLFLTHPRLPFRICVYICPIVIEQITLNVSLARLTKKRKFICPEIRVIPFDIRIVSHMARPRRLKRQEICAQRAFVGRAIGPKSASRFPIGTEPFVMRDRVLNDQRIDPFGMD